MYINIDELRLGQNIYVLSSEYMSKETILTTFTIMKMQLSDCGIIRELSCSYTNDPDRVGKTYLFRSRDNKITDSLGIYVDYEVAKRVYNSFIDNRIEELEDKKL